MKNNLFISTLLALATFAVAQAKQVETPAIKGNSAFAVIVDNATYEKCRAELSLYKQTVESEGLPTLIVADEWATPEQVRAELLQLKKEHNIEGCVFVGEIPIPMVQRAQHLTTAFKMDERKHPVEECSVPSDRYYDDFDLVFDRMEEHPAQGLMHFYAMSPTSPQYIECDIYSARIKPQGSNGDPYKQISAYLKKAVEEHKSKNEFDQFVSYTGHGSHSDSHVAWRSEQQIVNEQFGDRFLNRNNGRFTRYMMEPYMKYDCIRELRRDDLDFMIYHQHGDYFRMYISGDPHTYSIDEHIEQMEYRLRELYRRSPKSANKMAEQWGLDSVKWHLNANEQALKEEAALWVGEDREGQALLEKLDPEELAPGHFQARNKLLKKYGYDRYAAGRDYVPIVAKFFNPWYSIRDYQRYAHAASRIYRDFVASEEFAEFSLEGRTEYKVPYYNINGDRDYQCNFKLAQAYFDRVQAPEKKLILMKDMPHGLMESRTKEFSELLHRLIAK